METTVHVNSSSSPGKPTVPPMYVKSDENDQNYPWSIANSNQRKVGETENFVKKKVLTDRNEVVDLKRNEDLDFTNVDSKSISCKEDSQTKLPYDPLTNYLSPRPKFLRFKPNRRREILRRVGEENFEIGVSKDSLSVSHSSSSEEEKETEMQEKEKLEEESEAKSTEIYEETEDENEEEGDVNRGWTVKDLLKLLLVIVSLVLCTAYITSMNAPTPSFEVSGAFRSGFCPILNNTGRFGSSVVVESINANGSHFWDEEVTEAASNMNANEGLRQFDDHHEDERNLGLMEETEVLNVDNESKVYGDLVKLEYTEAEEIARGTVDEEKVEDEDNGVEFSQLTAKDDGDDLPNRKEFGISDAIVEEDEDRQDELIVALKPPILNELDQDNLFEILTVAGNEYTSQMEVVEKEEAEEWEMIESNTGGVPESSAVGADKISILERITNEIFSFVEDLKSVLMELMHTETETVLKAVLGLSVSSAILTCLTFSFQFKKKKDDKKESVISMSVEPLLQSPVAKAEEFIKKEAPSPLTKLTCDVGRSNNEPIRKRLSSSIHSRDELESFKVMYHHEAPTVQFLSEFVVNDISNSLRNKSGFENRTIEEAEDSNFPVSVEEKPVSKHMNSGPEQATSEFSTTSSPSYGSFTTKRKIVKKKEVGGDRVVIPTPVRRSTRIRNRIVSP